MLTSKTPFSIITNRAKRLLDDLEERIQRGEINTRVSLLAHILDAVARFTRGLREPGMIVHRMGRDELLIREFVTEPIDLAVEDIDLAHQQIAVLRDLTRQTFNVSQAERLGLGENLAEATALMDSFRLWVSDSDAGFLWAGDTFNDQSKVDPGSTAYVETRGGTVTLQPVASQSLSDRIVAATIDRKISAGGLPGNNLEIRLPGQAAFTGETPEPRPVLFSDAKPRKDVLSALWDGNPDSWFEWERNYIDPAQTLLTAGQALIYDSAGKTTYKTRQNRFLGIKMGRRNEGLQIPQLPNWNVFIRWPGDLKLDTGTANKGYPLAYFKPEEQQDLRLGIEIHLSKPTKVAWMQLTPLIKGNTYPEVEQITYSRDGKIWRKLLDVPTVLNPRMNRGVDFVELGNAASNFEGVGVWPFPNQEIQHIKIVLRQSKSYEPELGVGHRFTMEPKKRHRVQGPIQVVGSFQSVLTDTEELDFAANEGETGRQILEGFDVFRARRQCIAIRDLLLEERTYAETGQLVSRPHTLGRPVKSVALLTTEKVPEDWPAAQPDGSPWISYQVSPDGHTWIDIVPQITQIEDSIVRFEAPTSAIYFRASFARPADRPNETAILQSYALKMLP